VKIRGTRHSGTLPVADLVITGGLVALFAWGLSQATEWSVRAGLFPRLVTTFGLALAALYLLLLLLPGRARRAATTAPTTVSEAEEEDPLDYAFTTAGARMWTISLAWIAGFFLALYVVGLLITAPLFTVAYLRVSGGASWRLSVIYALVVGVLLYVAFEVLFALPTPDGLFS
jgi:hypothetical protein